MNTIDVMKQALSAIRYCQEYKMGLPSFVDAADDLEQAIKQEALNLKAENARELGLDYEPVPVKTYSGGKAWPVQTEWVGFIEEEILKIAYPIRWQEVDDFEADKAVNFAQMIEAKLKEKNSKG
jgi:hypothetical protein